MNIKTKRIYEPPSHEDGYRVLVDRIWPRGISKARAGVDLWLKEIAPSHELRRWFGHDPERWSEFKQRYFYELDGLDPEVVKALESDAEATLTLVYSARDTDHNQAVALKEYLKKPNTERHAE